MESKKVYDLIVVGAGPAGVAAASYGERIGLKVLLIYKTFGGQFRYFREYNNPNWIDQEQRPYKAEEVIEKYRKILSAKRVEIKEREIVEVNKEENIFLLSDKEGEKYYSKTVILATGRMPDPFEIKFSEDTPEELKKVFLFTDYPYQEIKENSKVLIIGGGHVGLDMAQEVYDKASEVIILEKEKVQSINKTREDFVKSRKNIQWYFGALFQEVVYRNGKTAAKVLVDNQVVEIEYDHLFFAAGTKVVSPKGCFQKDNGVICVKDEHSKDIRLETDISGLFACGDCIETPNYGFGPSAEGSGMIAAKSAFLYLKKKKDLEFLHRV